MKTNKAIIISLVVLFAGGCISQPSERSVVTATFTNRPQITLTHTATPSRTPTATYTPTLTPTITRTPLPTLSASERKVKIKNLLETNGGCELPCWWGITPNKTSWSETLFTLTPFVTYSGQGSVEYFWEGGLRHRYTRFEFIFEIAGEEKQGRIELGVIDDTVVSINVYPPATKYRYELHNILDLLGPPEQIFISAQQSSPIPDLPPVMFVLDYSDRGVWAAYGSIPLRVGDQLQVCPNYFGKRSSIYDNVGGHLVLFDLIYMKSSMISIKEYADIAGGFTAKKLDDVTNMTMMEFYDSFIDPSSSTCLETPANLWP